MSYKKNFYRDSKPVKKILSLLIIYIKKIGPKKKFFKKLKIV
jgi:hypothetical protein